MRKSETKFKLKLTRRWLSLVAFTKRRFPNLRKFKLSPCGDDPFKIVKRIKHNAYQLDLPAEYGVHSSFNIIDLIPFVGPMDEDAPSNLRKNLLQGRGRWWRPFMPIPSSRPNPWPTCISSPKPTKRLNNKEHSKEDPNGFPQNGHTSHGLQLLFSWTKKMWRYEEIAWLSIRVVSTPNFVWVNAFVLLKKIIYKIIIIIIIINNNKIK